RHFSGNQLFPSAHPCAQKYAGHQFGSFNPRLGDGRALLLGEVIDENGARKDVQLKGAGPTPYSRNGDGRAALGPVLREYLISEAMYHLGVSTTRALAAVSSGEAVWRQGQLPGAVLTRVASSHIRVGTFEFFYRQGQLEEVKTLADYVIARHYPQAQTAANPYLALLDGVITAQAELVAHWMQLGFIHGVMNTDNTSISGETIDYGPCAFMDKFVFHQCFSSIDMEGRYAYSRQPQIALWNLSRLAECLLALLDDNQQNAIAKAEASLERFHATYQNAWLRGWRKKLALDMQSDDTDARFILDYLQCLRIYGLDFSATNRNLAAAITEALPNTQLSAKPQLSAWLAQWRERILARGLSTQELKAELLAANPAYIPRNYWVEKAIQQAQENGDFTLFYELLSLLQQPFTEQPGKEIYCNPPPAFVEPYQTFCGT
ncbi:MAG TPA: YdiU family protein, partial [Cellvibrionaceae bacterium]|nr:YdiU family protein [Cellvibrionaceae bacterium]